MISHLNYLHEKIFELKQLEINNLSEPTLFEYYSAVFLTNHYNQPFYLWKDLSPSQKQNFNLPCRDKGVDISNCSFTILGQSKYYSKNSTVTYGKLSTFFVSVNGLLSLLSTSGEIGLSSIGEGGIAVMSIGAGS